MKYRLIAGTINRYPAEEGWENLHLDASPRTIWHPDLNMGVQPEFVMDLAQMTGIRNEQFDEVRLSHVLEHLTMARGVAAIGEVYRVLKPGGTLDIEVPDLDILCETWLNRYQVETDADLLQWFYSEDVPNMQDAHLNAHRYGYNERTLRHLLTSKGFKVDERIPAGLGLRFKATKPS